MRVQFFAALCVALIAVSWQARSVTQDADASDGGAYLSVARDLLDKGIITDGSYRPWSAVTGRNDEGMFFAPLYPALVAAIMKIDPVFRETVICHQTPSGTGPDVCPQGFGLFGMVQIVLAAMSAFLVWLGGLIVTNRYSVAWIALGLSLTAECYAYWTGQIMTESLVFPLFNGACVAAAAAWKYRSARLWFLAGILMGLAALTRPSFAFIFYAAVPVLAAVYGRTALRFPLLLAMGYALAVGPWIARNAIILDTPAISKGYDSYTLVHRVAYNTMSWKEWGVSFIYGLPDFGDGLAKKYFAPEDYERFAYDHPQGFYLAGVPLRLETIEKAGGIEHHLGYLIREEIAGNAFKHMMVTFSLAWRGVWVSKYWGLITVPMFVAVFVMAWRRGWDEFIVFALPPWFMLGLHAFTSVNVIRYNLLLVPCLSVAAAFLLWSGFRLIQDKRKLGPI